MGWILTWILLVLGHPRLTPLYPSLAWVYTLLGITFWLKVSLKKPRRGRLFWSWLLWSSTFGYWMAWMARSDHLHPLGPVCVLILAGGSALLPTLWLHLWSYGDGTSRIHRLLAASTWALLEHARDYGCIGFPWYHLGIGWVEVLPELYGWVGPAGAAGILIALALEWDALTPGEDSTRHGLSHSYPHFYKGGLLLLPFVLTYLLSYLPMASHQVPIMAVLVNSYSSQRGGRYIADMHASRGLITRLNRVFSDIKMGKLWKNTDDDKDQRLLILPEGLIPDTAKALGQQQLLYGPHSLAYLSHLYQGTSVISIEDDTLGDKVHNSLWVFDNQGDCLAAYDKQALLPLGETLPGISWSWLGGYIKILARKFGIFRTLTPGQRAATFHLPSGVCVGLLICYEETLPELVRQRRQAGALIALSASNDSWFPDGRLAFDHALHTRIAAASVGIPILRSCHDGITGVIDGLGRWKPSTQVKIASDLDLIVFQGLITSKSTLFSWFGAGTYFLPWLLFLLLALWRLRQIKVAS